MFMGLEVGSWPPGVFYNSPLQGAMAALVESGHSISREDGTLNEADAAEVPAHRDYEQHIVAEGRYQGEATARAGS